MNNEKNSRSSILDAIDTETKVMALIALVMEAALLATLAFLPSEHTIYGLLICAAVLVVLAVGIVCVEVAEKKRKPPTDNESFHAQATDRSDAPPAEELSYDERLVADLVKKLKENHFRPDLIVAIARGGLIAAGYLSKQLKEYPTTIPVISLWRTRDKADVDYQNSFNHVSLDPKDFHSDARGHIKVLIVDAFCISGRTLEVAKEYVKQLILTDKDNIKTAAVILRRVRDRKTDPSFLVLETTKEVYAFGERE